MARGIKKRTDRSTIRSKAINIRLTKKEYRELINKMNENNYNGSVSSYVRSLIVKHN